MLAQSVEQRLHLGGSGAGRRFDEVADQIRVSNRCTRQRQSLPHDLCRTDRNRRGRCGTIASCWALQEHDSAATYQRRVVCHHPKLPAYLGISFGPVDDLHQPGRIRAGALWSATYSQFNLGARSPAGQAHTGEESEWCGASGHPDQVTPQRRYDVGRKFSVPGVGQRIAEGQAGDRKRRAHLAGQHIWNATVDKQSVVSSGSRGARTAANSSGRYQRFMTVGEPGPTSARSPSMRPAEQAQHRPRRRGIRDYRCGDPPHRGCENRSGLPARVRVSAGR